MNGMLLLGDSLTKGIGDDRGGWAARLARQTSAHVNIVGIGGGNTETTVERLTEFDPRPFDVVILQIGINDSRYRPSLNRQEVPVDDFARNMRTITDHFRAAGATVAVMGLTRVDETLAAPFKEDKYYRNNLIAEYDRILAERHGFSADYIKVPLLADTPGLLTDGVHPSSQGHQELLSAVLFYLRSLSFPPTK